MDTNYIIETKNLTKQYGSQKSVADLNIHVKRGRIYGLLGRNGVKSFFVCKFTFSLLGYCILCGVLAELCKDAALFFIVFCHIE